MQAPLPDPPIEPSGPDNPFLERQFSAALAARERPEIQLPPRPVTHTGRCVVEIGPRPAEVQALISDEVAARNGEAARDLVSFDLSGNGTLRSLEIPSAGTGPVSRTETETLALVVPFVVTNYDLFGLSHDDIDTARVRVLPESKDPEVQIARDIELVGRAPALSTDPPAWRAHLTLRRNGQLGGMLLRSEELVPDVALCEPRAALLTQVIGYHLQYGGVGGETVDAGIVRAGDIGRVTLVTRRQTTARADTVQVQLAYQVSVSRGSLGWAFFVDVDTGALIAVEQQFQT